MENNNRNQLNRNWQETAELLGLTPQEPEEALEEIESVAESQDESWPGGAATMEHRSSQIDIEDDPVEESDSDGFLGETMPELESSEKEEAVATDDRQEESLSDFGDSSLSFSMNTRDAEPVPSDGDDWNDDECGAETESFDAYDSEVDVFVEEFSPVGEKENTVEEDTNADEEPEEKRGKKGRKRGRRGKKGKKSAEPKGDDQPAADESDDDDLSDSRRRKKRGRKEKKEEKDGVDDDELSDLGVPSWNELIASLYRPD